MAELWRIEELRAVVALALDEIGYEGATNARVRSVPDTRTIRYYTTLGMIDRPAQMQGRTAFYGPKHVLQIAAIKKLQAEGQPLNAIQQQLASTTDRKLRTMVGLPKSFWQSVPTRLAKPNGKVAKTKPADKPTGKLLRKSNKATDGQKRQAARSQGDFWATPAATKSSRQKLPQATSTSQPVHSIRLEIAPGVSLHFDELPLSDADRLKTEAIQAAIQQLYTTLQDEDLLPNNEDQNKED